jgi:hypothetical protein
MLVELVDANHHVFAGCVECRSELSKNFNQAP